MVGWMTMASLQEMFTGVPCCKEAPYHILADETVNTFLPWVPLKSLNGGEHIYKGYWNRHSIHFVEARVGSPWGVFVTEAGDKYAAAVAAPIISEGDVLGLNIGIEDFIRVLAGALDEFYVLG